MRLTLPLQWHNRHRMYRFFWQRYRRAKVHENSDAVYCSEAGLDVVDATKYLDEYKVNEPPPPKAPVIIRESRERPMYRDPPQNIHLNEESTLLGLLPQARILTNSVIFHHLPEHLQAACEDQLSPSDSQACLRSLEDAYLLDSYQLKLPDYRTVEEKKNYPRPAYGVPIQRQGELLIQNYLTLIEKQMSSEQLSNSLILKDTSSQATVDHGDRKITLNFDAAYLTLRKSGLDPPLTKDEVSILDNTEMPDLFPQSPYSTYHDMQPTSLPEDHFCTTTRRFVPHTVYYVNKSPVFYLQNDTSLSCISVMAAFTFASAYAKEIYGKDLNGDLPSPLTMQLVHVAHKHSQVIVCQLNTLNLTGPRKNVFWFEPIVRHFDTCDFEAAAPLVQGFNPYLYKAMKAIHRM